MCSPLATESQEAIVLLAKLGAMLQNGIVELQNQYTHI